jgi:hypothetical protein
MANIFHDVDEWIFAQGLEHTWDTTLIREAWNQATLTARAQARVQLGLLQGELDMCHGKVKELEKEIISLDEYTNIKR